MEVLELLVIAGLAAVVVLLLRAQRTAPAAAPRPPSEPESGNRSAGGEDLLDVVRALPGATVVVAAGGRILHASQEISRLNLVRRGALVFDEVAAIARESADRQTVIVRELSLRRPPLRKGLFDLRVRAIPLEGEQVLMLLDDLTEEHRVATVRRDFIANISHELKTPVGAISLLAEALMSASDDPAAVQHFAARMHTEAGRLANLINDVIDLSRLQGDNPLAAAQPVRVDDLVAEAVESVRATAEAKDIEVVVGGRPGLVVLGVADQLVTAVRNLLTNAIAYSPGGTRVAVGVRLRDGTVEIAVKDQGIGIEESEQSRIFERFYRVDEARSRVTGGTGLGLAIVRNVCHNHGGDVSVWSVVGEGSTFTIRLPAHEAPEPGADPDHAGREPQIRPMTEGSNR